MKTAVSLIVGIVLGLAIAYASGPVLGHFSGQNGFAGFHGSEDATEFRSVENSSKPSPAVSLMRTDTALCEQPYFIELYELSVLYVSESAGNVRENDFSEIVFDHVRSSGYFTVEEGDAWIRHIEDIPRQLVEILKEDPAVLESCYNFQVAGVGPPA